MNNQELLDGAKRTIELLIKEIARKDGEIAFLVKVMKQKDKEIKSLKRKKS